MFPHKGAALWLHDLYLVTRVQYSSVCTLGDHGGLTAAAATDGSVKSTAYKPVEVCLLVLAGLLRVPHRFWPHTITDGPNTTSDIRKSAWCVYTIKAQNSAQLQDFYHEALWQCTSGCKSLWKEAHILFDDVQILTEICSTNFTFKKVIPTWLIIVTPTLEQQLSLKCVHFNSSQLRTLWLYNVGQLCVVSQVVSDILWWYVKPQHVNLNSGGDCKADPSETWTLFSFDDNDHIHSQQERLFWKADKCSFWSFRIWVCLCIPIGLTLSVFTRKWKVKASKASWYNSVG